MRKRTHEEYVEELRKVNPALEVLGQYIESNQQVLHRNLYGEVNIRPTNALRGKQGKIRSAKNKIKYLEGLLKIKQPTKSLGYKILGPIKDMTTKILVEDIFGGV